MSRNIDWFLEYPSPSTGDYGLGTFVKTIDCAVLNGIYYATLQARNYCFIEGLKSLVLISKSFSPTFGAMPDFIFLRPESGFGYIEAVDTIRKEITGDIWLMGDHDMLSVFMSRGLIDEITLNIVPITLGNGYSPFSQNMSERNWRLENCTSFDNGVVQIRYTAKQ